MHWSTLSLFAGLILAMPSQLLPQATAANASATGKECGFWDYSSLVLAQVVSVAEKAKVTPGEFPDTLTLRPLGVLSGTFDASQHHAL